MKENKRGMLLAEETLKMVIALIAISFLVYFLVSLYFANQKNQDLELAKTTLNKLAEDIDANENNFELEIFSPEKRKVSAPFVLVSWPHAGVLPKSCSNLGWESCLCICYPPGYFSQENAEDFSQSCDDQGVCLENKKNLFVFEYELDDQVIPLENLPITIKINYKNKEITKK